MQDSTVTVSGFISAATRLRRLSEQFGAPMLLWMLAAPTDARELRESLLILFLLGCPSLIFGCGLRLWAKGYHRTEGFVLDGPYRYVRNPVELGALLCYAGAGVILGTRWWYNLIGLALAMGYMAFVSVGYEKELFARFGGYYLRYSQRVARWIPSRFPATNRSNLTYSFGQALRFETKSLIWLLGFAMVFAFKHRARV